MMPAWRLADCHGLRRGGLVGRPVQDRQAVRTLKLEIASLVFAMKLQREIDDRDKAMRAQSMDLANGHLATAKLATRLAVGRFFDTAIDEEVARRLPAGRRGEVERLRAMLDRLRAALCEVVERV